LVGLWWCPTRREDAVFWDRPRVLNHRVYFSILRKPFVMVRTGYRLWGPRSLLPRSLLHIHIYILHICVYIYIFCFYYTYIYMFILELCEGDRTIHCQPAFCSSQAPPQIVNLWMQPHHWLFCILKWRLYVLVDFCKKKGWKCTCGSYLLWRGIWLTHFMAPIPGGDMTWGEFLEAKRLGWHEETPFLVGDSEEELEEWKINPEETEFNNNYYADMWIDFEEGS